MNRSVCSSGRYQLAALVWQGFWSLANRPSRIIALSASLILTISACASSSNQSDSSASGEQTISVGSLMTLSGGPVATIGLQEYDGVKAFVTQFNADPKSAFKLKLDSRDDQQSTTVALEQFRAMAASSDVALIGETGVDSIALTMPLAKQDGFPMISFALAGSADGNRYWFRAAWPNNTTVQDTMALLAKLGDDRIAWLNAEESAGEAGYQAATSLASSTGVQIVAHEVYPSNTTDVSIPVSKAVAAHPSAYIVWDPTDETRLGLVVKTIRGLGVSVPIGVPEAAASPVFVKTVGTANNIYYWGAYAAQDILPTQTAAVNQLKAEGATPSDASLAGYTMAQLIAGAITMVINQHQPVTRLAVRNALESMRDYPTAYAPATYTATNHDSPFGPVTFIEYVNNQQKHVRIQY
jgi:Periplasmic binding protein